MKDTRYIHIIKHIVYVLLLLLLYVLQTVPGLFVVFGVKPVLVVPAALTIAMLEGEFVGCIYGVFAGLLCDLGGFSLFGFNGLFVGLCCLGAGLLVTFLMHANLQASLLFVLVTLYICGSLEFYFSIAIRGYDGTAKLYLTTVIARVLYSTVITPLVFLFMRRLHRKFAKMLGD